MNSVVFTVLKIYLLTALLLPAINLHSQSEVSGDSNLINDNLTLKELFNAADSNININPQLSLSYAKTALQKARDEKNEDIETKLYNILGLANYYIGDRKEALTYFIISKKRYLKKNDFGMISVTLNRIGSIYHEWSLYDAAMNYFIEALNVAEKNKTIDNYDEVIAMTYNNIGLLYKDMDETEKAYDYLQKALNHYNKTGNTRMISYIVNNLGIIYKRIGKYDKALEYYNESLLYKIKLNDSRGISNSYGNIGDVYFLQKKYNQALKHYNDALEIMIKNNDKYGIANTNKNIATVYMNQGNTDEAISLLIDALNITINNNIRDTRKEIYKTLSAAYEMRNDLGSSLYYHKRYSDLKDSILNESNLRKIIELEIAFNTQKKEQENEILRLNAQKKEKELAEAISMRYYLYLLIIILLFIGVVLIIRYNLLKKNRLALEQNSKQIELVNEQLVSINKELDNKVYERTQELLSENKEKEKMLRQSQEAFKKAEEANLLKDAFLANINHEIRTPLSAIIGLAEVLKKKCAEYNGHGYEKYIEGIQQSGYRLLCLLNNILDISRIEANDFKINLSIIDANTVLLSTLEIFKFKINEKGLKLVLNMGKTTHAVGDRDILSKVVTDILDNSVKYTDTGHIEISTGYHFNSSEVYIKIADTGIGIEESYLPHIFETFRQESMGYDRLYQGVGLGLPLAKRLLKLMNGRIEISSKKDKGTTVTIFLPSGKEHDIDATAISYESVSISYDELSAKNVNILLVEDDKFNAMFLQTILETLGNVYLAAGGDEALEHIDKFKSIKKVFDILILDINLPENWEGVSLMKAIKKSYPEYISKPFIAQSAYSLISDREKFFSEGFNEFLTKPVDSDSLLNTIKKYLIKKNQAL